MIETTCLDSGAKFLFDSVRGTKAFSIGFWFPAGSRFEDPGERGFTHIVEHMLFKGTHRRSALRIAQEIDRVGGYLNAFTERETMCVFCTIPADEWRLAVEILADMCFSSVMPEAEFERERTVIVNEILSARDDPEELANDEFLERIWKGEGISRKIAGEAEEVSLAGRNQVFEYYGKTICPELLLVTAAGDLPGREILDYLGGLLPGKSGKAERRTAPVPAFRPIREHRKSPHQQVQFFAGRQLEAPFNTEDYYAISVFNCAFGESMSSRLFQRLREREGFCYTVFSYPSFATNVGLWSIYGSTSPEQFPLFLKSLESEIASLKAGKIDQGEMDDAKSHIRGMMRIASEDVETRMKRLARQYFFNALVYSIEEAEAFLMAVKRERVCRFIEESLFASNFALFAFGPKKLDSGGRLDVFRY